MDNRGYLFTALTALMLLSVFTLAYYYHSRQGTATVFDVTPFKNRAVEDNLRTNMQDILALQVSVGRADNVTVTFEGFPPSWASSLTCFNSEGTDEKGVAFTKRIDVSAGEVQPLWMGVRIPPDQRAGSVEGSVTVQTANRGSQSIPVTLQVLNGRAMNHGFDEPELQSRLFWLDSTLGTDPDFIIDPFEPVRVEDSAGPAGAPSG